MILVVLVIAILIGFWVLALVLDAIEGAPGWFYVIVLFILGVVYLAYH